MRTYVRQILSWNMCLSSFKQSYNELLKPIKYFVFLLIINKGETF